MFDDGSIAMMAGYLLTAAALVFVTWAIYSLVRIALRPAERRTRAIRLAVWMVAFTAAFAVQAQRDAGARRQADAAAAAIVKHKERAGAYPAALGEAGVDAQALKQQISLSYRARDGQAFLFYSQPSMPLVAHHYNFATRAWGRQD